MTTLTAPPALGPLLARGALLSPFKRPRPDAAFPREALVLPDARVDLARLAAYERVCGFATGERTLPVTHPHVLGFPLAMRLMSGRDFPLPLLGLVHTSIGIRRYAGVPATGSYDLTVRVAELLPHRRGTEAAVVTELRDGGTVLWESRSTYLARHRTEAAGSQPESGGRPGKESEEASGQAAREEPGQEPGKESEEASGQEPGKASRETGSLPVVDEWRLAGDVGRRYGAASGDRNPIHLHPVTARLFGFPRAIAHGMWTVARCLAAHGTPDAVEVHAEFRAPVLLPGTVAYAARGERFELRSGSRVHVSGRVERLTSP